MFCLQNRLLGGQRPRASLRLEQPCLPRAFGSFLSPASGFFKPLPVGTQVLWVSRTLRAPEPGQGHPDTAWGPLPAGAQRGCGPPPSPCGELGQDSESSEQACRRPSEDRPSGPPESQSLPCISSLPPSFPLPTPPRTEFTKRTSGLSNIWGIQFKMASCLSKDLLPSLSQL